MSRILGARLACLNRELEFRKRRVHELWKKGQATQKDYKVVVMFAGRKLEEPKPNWNLIWLLLQKKVKNCFYDYMSNKRRAKENLHPLLNGG